MADRKAGPVKPPVIEGVARETPAKPDVAPAQPAIESKPEPAPPPPKAEPRPEPAPVMQEPVKQEPPKPNPPPPPPRKPEPPHPGINKPSGPPPHYARPNALPAGPGWPLLGGVALGGAVLGTLLTYLLANVFALPSPLVPIADPTPRLVAQEQRADGFEERLGALEISAARTQVSLDATIAQLDSAVTELRQDIEDVRTAIPAPVTIDLSGIETELKTLKSRVDALAAGVSGDDADAISQSLAAIDTNIAALGARIDGLDGRLGALDGTLASLRTDLEASRKLLNDHIASALPNEVGPALKLPLILSGLETAFSAGKPFALELTALATVLPDLIVPERLTIAAESGLIRPDALMQRFAAALPDMLAARAGSKGNWTEDALDWLKSLLALRPADEVEGDTPDAIVSRLEAAMERRDYAAASTFLDALPVEMRNAAGTLGADIAAHADADRLVAELRRRALTGMETAP